MTKELGILFVTTLILLFSEIVIAENTVLQSSPGFHVGAIHGRVYIQNSPSSKAHVIVTDKNFHKLYGEALSLTGRGPDAGKYDIGNLPTNTELYIYSFHEKVPNFMAFEKIKLDNNELKQIILNININFMDPGSISGSQQYGPGIALRLATLFNQAKQTESTRNIVGQLLELVSKNFDNKTEVDYQNTSPTNQLVTSKFTDPTTGMDFVCLKGGIVHMKHDELNLCDMSKKEAHEDTVGTFCIGIYEVTQQQWVQIMGWNPSEYEGENKPVDRATWKDTQEFISKLSQMSSQNYRLPSEAEWEYAAQGGPARHIWAGTSSRSKISEYVVSNRSKKQGTMPVGSKKPNAFGIYDMSGNVSEWVDEPCVKSKPSGKFISMMMRGGFYLSDKEKITIAYHNGYGAHHPVERLFPQVGFRLVFSPAK